MQNSRPRSFTDLSLVTEECPTGSAESRVDISITGPGFLIFIEVKIDAPVGPRQLERYLEEVAAKAISFNSASTAVILLTREGKRPQTANVASLGWRDVQVAASRVSRSLERGDWRANMLAQFADHVRSF